MCHRRIRSCRAAAIAAIALSAVAVAPARAAQAPGAPPEQTVALAAPAGPGPGSFDRVFVHRVGNPTARTVLVLLPSFAGGAGELTLLARQLVAAVPGLQVWDVDGRWQAFEDTSVFATGDPSAAFSYYLGLQPVAGRSFRPVDGSTVPYVRQWGLALYLADIRRVVRAARSGGRRVVLGGHGVGGETALAYAGWDFAGRAGYRDLAGLAVVDAPIQPGIPVLTRGDARDSLRLLARDDPFQFLLEGVPPWAPGVFLETGALLAKTRPQEPSLLQTYPLLPIAFRPPVRLTNEALLGFALDKDTSPPSFEGLRVRAGALAAAGDPRPWAQGERTAVQRVAETFAQEPSNAVSWYWPFRLSIDLDGAAALEEDGAADLLGLRIRHMDEVDVPVYALQTELTGRFLLHNVRGLMRASHIPRGRSVLVDRRRGTSPLDPLIAAQPGNPMIPSLVGFLQSLR